MRIPVFSFLLFLCLTQTQSVYAIDCDECVGRRDLGSQSVTTTAIRKNAVTENKLAPDIVERIGVAEDIGYGPLGLVIEDGDGNRLPITRIWRLDANQPISPVQRDLFGFPYAAGLLKVADDIRIGVNIVRWCGVNQKFCFTTDDRLGVQAIYYAGLNCTGQAYAVFSAALTGDLLVPRPFAVRQPENRTLQVFRAGAPLPGPVLSGSRETGGYFEGFQGPRPVPVACENTAEVLDGDTDAVQPVSDPTDFVYKLPLSARYLN